MLNALIANAQQLLDDNADLLAQYDENASPLRTHLDLGQETELRNSEKRSVSGIERIGEGLALSEKYVNDPDIDASVKADILFKIKSLLSV